MKTRISVKRKIFVVNQKKDFIENCLDAAGRRKLRPRNLNGKDKIKNKADQSDKDVYLKKFVNDSFILAEKEKWRNNEQIV